MFDSSNPPGTITVRSLGKTVTYNPEQLFATLRARYTPELLESDISVDEINRRVVRKIYADHNHTIDSQIAGGVVQLVYVGTHVSPLVLNAYLEQ